MSWRRRLMVAAMLACGLTLLITSLVPVSGFNPLAIGMAVAAVLAAALAAAVEAATHRDSGPAFSPRLSAQARRRGAFLRQSNPDTDGRARPRAPGRVLG